MENRELSFCEQELVRRNTTFDKISSSTLLKAWKVSRVGWKLESLRGYTADELGFSSMHGLWLGTTSLLSLR
jgi:hypothetical protein